MPPRSVTSESRPLRVVVTGAGGFIGGHLVHHLTAAGMEVHGVTRRAVNGATWKCHVGECGDRDFIAGVMGRVTPDFVVHLASRTAPGRNLDDFERQLADTVLPSLVVARALPDSVNLAIFFGSCEEYGNAEPPFVEDQPRRCFSPSGWAKDAAREGVFLTGRLTGRSVCWVRPFLTFGPGQRPGLFVPDVIRACLDGTPLALTAGEQTRDFIPVDDVCGMVLRILAAPDRARGETINLCSGRPRTIRSVAETIRTLVGRGDLRFGSLPYRADEATRFFGSTAKYDRLFGRWEASDFDAAMAATIRTIEAER